MSMKDRLAKKTQDLTLPVKGDGMALATNMRTGPGQMLMVNSLMKESNEKLAVLEQRLRQFEGGLPVLLLPAEHIAVSKWANRVAASFIGSAFDALRADIANAGGNVQPIKVRPIDAAGERYEIIFGHRRHRACLELGLPVLALVEAVTDAELFKQMDRENRARADLSPWEQGRMYQQALHEKLFASREQLARELGIDPGNLSKALRLASLEQVVVDAFGSPLVLQYRWAKPLADALLQDRDRVEQVARDLAAAPRSTHAPKTVFDRLVGAVVPEVRVHAVRVGKRVVADIRIEGERVSVNFTSGVVDGAAVSRLREFIGAELFR